MSWKEDAPQFKEQQISRLQRQLRRHPQQRKMRDYDTLGASFSFVFGFAIGAAIVFPLVPINDGVGLATIDVIARLFEGFMGGLFFGFLPAGAFVLGFKIPIHFGKREPRSGRPPKYLGIACPVIALATMFGLEALSMDTSWSFLALFVWAFLSGLLWVQLSPKKADVLV